MTAKTFGELNLTASEVREAFAAQCWSALDGISDRVLPLLVGDEAWTRHNRPARATTAEAEAIMSPA